MTAEEQLEKWVNGESIHNDERNECCPDFSCCHPHLLVHKETREQFHKAYTNKQDQVVSAFLEIFLAKMVKELFNKEVYVSGSSFNQNNEH